MFVNVMNLLAIIFGMSSTVEKKEDEKLVYTIRPLKKGERYATKQEAIAAGKVSLYGLVKVDPKIVQHTIDQKIAAKNAEKNPVYDPIDEAAGKIGEYGGKIYKHRRLLDETMSPKLTDEQRAELIADIKKWSIERNLWIKKHDELQQEQKEDEPQCEEIIEATIDPVINIELINIIPFDQQIMICPVDDILFENPKFEKVRSPTNHEKPHIDIKFIEMQNILCQQKTKLINCKYNIIQKSIKVILIKKSMVNKVIETAKNIIDVEVNKQKLIFDQLKNISQRVKIGCNMVQKCERDQIILYADRTYNAFFTTEPMDDDELDELIRKNNNIVEILEKANYKGFRTF
jgi:hypothetical protein